MTVRADYKEVCRYLGYRGGAHPEGAAEEALSLCIRRVESIAQPRSVSRRAPLTVLADGALQLGDLTVRSSRLAAHLADCEEILFFAATLGAEVDRLIYRDAAEHISRAAMEQAAAAALIESYCDQICDQLDREARKEGFFLRSRFSPGYGDFPISFQQDITRILLTPSRIGLTVTDSMLLAPMKSVTAVIGMARTPAPCPASRCEHCSDTTCVFRR